jgi:hypothetical protein
MGVARSQAPLIKPLIASAVAYSALNAPFFMDAFGLGGEIALEPFDMAVAFEGENMRGSAIQEEPMVRNDNRERVPMDQMIAFDRDARLTPAAFNPPSTRPFLHKNLAGAVPFSLAREENHCESYVVPKRAIKDGHNG